MRDPRMARRMSQAPRMSVVFSPIQLEDINMADEQDGAKRGSLKNFCCNHIKSIVTIIMVFGMVFCVVMIVMVHKWNFETNEAEYVKGCLDVAIIGAGLSGSYAAWKMKDHGLNMHVYEMSDRVGGMFHTMRLDDYPDLDLDIGVMSYIPEDQPRLDHLIRALQLPLHTLHPQNQGPPTFYLRGVALAIEDLNTSKIPYDLHGSEAGKNPETLTNYYKRLLLGDYYIAGNIFNLTSKGLQLYRQGYQNAIGKVASTEGRNFLKDTIRWRHLANNDNAAKLLFNHWDNLDNLTNKKHRTLQDGLQSVPQTLIDQFLNTSTDHSIRFNRRLACIRSKHGLYQLIFIKTKNTNGNIVDIRDSVEVCSRKVIVAVPPKSHKRIEWKPFDSQFKYKQSLNSVAEYPVIRVFFIFSKLWPNAIFKKDIYTDLPIKHYKYLGPYRYSNTTNQHHVFMVTEVDAGNLDYIKSLIDLKSFDGDNNYKCNDTKYLVYDIKVHISKLCGIHVDFIPNPDHVIIVDWTRNQGTGSWYNWKTGANWEKIDANMTKPQHEEDVYFIGGLRRHNVNSVLEHVDKTIMDYFPKTQSSHITLDSSN